MAIPISCSDISITAPAGTVEHKPNASLDVEVVYAGVTYRGKLARVRADLPHGARWNGDAIEWDSKSFRAVRDSGSGPGVVVFMTYADPARLVPLWVIEAFREEGLL